MLVARMLARRAPGARLGRSAYLQPRWKRTYGVARATQQLELQTAEPITETRNPAQPHSPTGLSAGEVDARNSPSEPPPQPQPQPPSSGPEAQPQAHSQAQAVPGPSVAELDAQRFKLHPSVAHWQGFTSPINTMWAADGQGSLYAPLQDLVQRGGRPLPAGGPRAAAYWAYHTARLGFFIGQAAAGVAAHHLSEKGPAALLPAPISAALGPDGPLGALLGAARGPSGPHRRRPACRHPHALREAERQCEAGAGEPGGGGGGHVPAGLGQTSPPAPTPCPGTWSPLGTARNNPLRVLSTTARFLNESVATLRRRVRGSPEPLWLKGGGLYPDYYQTTFHFQTDGWFSAKSAAIYEHSTEVLFLGRQDAMQRTSLLPLADFVRERAEQGVAPSQMRLLEVAAGTGRFHTFVKVLNVYLMHELPQEARAAAAREFARVLRPGGLLVLSDSVQRGDRRRGTASGIGMFGAFNEPHYESYITCDLGALFQAAGLQPDTKYVLNVYLMHELPQEARAAAAREFARVLRPGGLLVLSDSVQRGDRPAWDRNIGMFGAFNEPHYESYITCDLGALFQAAGLQPDTKSSTSTSCMSCPGGPRCRRPRVRPRAAARGLLVLSDSVQRGDRPAWDRNIGMFGAFNEPHYESYITCDLGALFQAAGLQPDTKYVLNVYLMHELPQEARAAAAREFARVLRPGGLLVLSDSVQRGDRPAWDRKSYITCDLGALFQAAGLQPDTKYVSSATKTLSFRKPLQG
ncbi:hypothetical protein HYH03_018017 [Edaphochlamys debaryana]|uniref:Uncharacterized protein n=1 Tax=Edaphochlamys debaryana TaxID=47281 RepID=A0A835XG29_9CHLO|nr:hypothetical protein HYH03_018017 [Edaphochlamys debaryana]|eukprot:KAG2483076.1 hypothetical protein HYH03_018017 [Edaphochlamys debaryana]